MKVENVRSLSLPKGVPVRHFETLKEALEHVKGSEIKLVDVLNMYGRQKDSLVDARDFLSEVVGGKVGEPAYTSEDKAIVINGLGFPVKTKTVKVDGKDTTVPDETEGKHINRFVDAIVDGSFTSPAFPVNGSNAEQKEAAAWTGLQALIDKHGPWTFDLNTAERVGKPKNPPKYAVGHATTIINNGAASIKKWSDRFSKGYKADDGVTLDPISFTPFDAAAPKGATPEQVEATRQTNITNLAWAIAALEEQRREKRAAKEYA